MNTKALIGVVVVIVILVGLYALLSSNLSVPPSITSISSGSQKAPSSTLLIALTDPPSVPENTSALVITYSDVQVQTSGAQNSGFIDTGASGSLNLMSIVNLTKTIASANISANSTINLIRFNITSANITVNGKTSNVSVPNNRLTVNVKNSESLGANGTSAVLIDMSPSVIEIYSGNQTLFLMVPSARAVLLANASGSGISLNVGGSERLKGRAKAQLQTGAANISITNASLSNGANETRFSITVKNNGNASVSLKHILLYGYMKAQFNATLVGRVIASENESERVSVSGSIKEGAGSSTSANSSETGRNESGSHPGNTSHSNISVNASINASINASATANVTAHRRPGGIMVQDVYQDYGSEYGSGYKSGYGSGSGYGTGQHGVANASSKINRSDSSAGTEIEGVIRGNASYGDKLASLEGMLGSRLNASVALSSHLNVSGTDFRDLAHEATNFQEHFHNTLNFIVATNGTLVLPFTENEAEGPNGYALGAGKSVTLVFNGVLARGESAVSIMPIKNETYMVNVVGEDGAFAQANVTAG